MQNASTPERPIMLVEALVAGQTDYQGSYGWKAPRSRTLKSSRYDFGSVMQKAILMAPMLALGVSFGAGAQTVSLTQNSLTNQDVVVLARAGFNEEFLIDLIGMSRTHFDTSPKGLSELAKQGLTEHLVRAMLSAAQVPSLPTAAPTTPGAPGALPSLFLTVPERRSRAPKTKDSTLAIERQERYSQSTSVLWGAWKNKTEVGANTAATPDPGMFLGQAYGQVKLTKSGEAPARP